MVNSILIIFFTSSPIIINSHEFSIYLTLFHIVIFNFTIFIFLNYPPMILSTLPFSFHSPFFIFQYTKPIWFPVDSSSPVFSFCSLILIINFPFIIFNFLIKLHPPCFHLFFIFLELLMITCNLLLFFFICYHLLFLSFFLFSLNSIYFSLYFFHFNFYYL